MHDNCTPGLPCPVTSRYGPDAGQEGDLHLPARSYAPVLCLLHGGFWRMPHGRDQMTAVADDLAHRGYAVWNLGYRRLGAAGGGWPGTLDDVADGIAHLGELPNGRGLLDLRDVVLVGHSAGGQLALWAARHLTAGHLDPERFAAARRPPCASRIRITGVVAQAAVSDLVRAYELGLGHGAAAELLDGTPESKPERYRAASPMMMLPLGVPQLVLHGTADAAVPIQLARDYAAAARNAGDVVKLVELDGAGHMEYLDPASAAHAALCAWLAAR